MRGRLLGVLAFPIMVAQCGPPQCAPEPPAPAPVTTAAPQPVVTNPAPPPAVPTPTPAVGSWSFLQADGARYTRWSTCGGAITYQIDTTVAPTAEERAALATALQAASAATGHTFVHAGDAGATTQPGVDAVIGFRDFPGGVLGETTVLFDDAYELTWGSAYVDVGLASDLLAAALLHEIAHLLGLGHVSDQAQLMFPYALQQSPTPPRFLQAYQSGDLEGLRLVGTTVQSGPCQARLRVAAEAVHEVTIN